MNIITPLQIEVYDTAKRQKVLYDVPRHIIHIVRQAALTHYDYHTHWILRKIGANLYALVSEYDLRHIIYSNNYIYADFIQVD